MLEPLHLCVELQGKLAADFNLFQAHSGSVKGISAQRREQQAPSSGMKSPCDTLSYCTEQKRLITILRDSP